MDANEPSGSSSPLSGSGTDLLQSAAAFARGEGSPLPPISHGRGPDSRGSRESCRLRAFAQANGIPLVSFPRELENLLPVREAEARTRSRQSANPEKDYPAFSARVCRQPPLRVPE